VSEVLIDLLAQGLTTETAHTYLASIPSVDDLVTPITIAELEPEKRRAALAEQAREGEHILKHEVTAGRGECCATTTRSRRQRRSRCRLSDL
jgi:hypothetical protein